VYVNPLLALVGRLLPTDDDGGDGARARSAAEATPAALAGIDWAAPKAIERNRARAAARLEAALCEREWFVTGRVRPELFSDAFVFKDPDVSLSGARAYALGVHRLFDQACSRAELVGVRVRADPPRGTVLDVSWRLAGGVTLGPLRVGLKAYVVETALRLDADGLLVAQEDVFSIPSYDILLSALLPVLRPLLAPEAPPAEQLRREFLRRADAE
jgi:hypothetical protein